MKYILTALLSVALIWTSQVQAAPINNSTSRVKTQAVQVATPEKVATQTLTEQQASVTSESPDPEQEAKAFIYQKESSNRTDAINQSSGACGIGQAWPCSKLPCTLQDYECQDRYFTGYMQSRYGSWSAAKAFWLSNCGSGLGCWW